jgi:hypothetical protein
MFVGVFRNLFQDCIAIESRMYQCPGISPERMKFVRTGFSFGIPITISYGVIGDFIVLEK